jgi:hypothetical protein
MTHVLVDNLATAYPSLPAAPGLRPDGDHADGRESDAEAFDPLGAGIDGSQLAAGGDDEQPPAVG